MCLGRTCPSGGHGFPGSGAPTLTVLPVARSSPPVPCAQTRGWGCALSSVPFRVGQRLVGDPRVNQGDVFQTERSCPGPRSPSGSHQRRLRKKIKSDRDGIENTRARGLWGAGWLRPQLRCETCLRPRPAAEATATAPGPAVRARRPRPRSASFQPKTRARARGPVTAAARGSRCPRRQCRCLTRGQIQRPPPRARCAGPAPLAPDPRQPAARGVDVPLPTAPATPPPSPDQQGALRPSQ